MAMAGPRFFGFVIGGALPVALAANWLARPGTRTPAMYNITPATARLEQTALRWLLELLDLPRESGGAFVTGATVANFVALAAARHAVLARVGWKVEADGLFGAPPITVVVGEEAHPTLIKSLGMLGLGRNRVVRVPVDGQGRMRVDALPEVSGPTIICTQVGNVNTGACDRRRRSARTRRRTTPGCMSTVRSACGRAPRRRAPISFAASRSPIPGRPTRTSGSTCRTTAAWRSCATPMRCSAAMAITAEYLPTESPWRNPSDYTPELSRRARGVDVWAALRSLGRSGVAEMIERNCRQARRFAEALAASGFEMLNEVVLNQVLVAFGDAATHAARDRGAAGRRHLLVRRHGLAGTHGDAHQRFARGRRPMPMSSAASRRCCAWLQRRPNLSARRPYRRRRCFVDTDCETR